METMIKLLEHLFYEEEKEEKEVEMVAEALLGRR